MRQYLPSVLADILNGFKNERQRAAISELSRSSATKPVREILLLLFDIASQCASQVLQHDGKKYEKEKEALQTSLMTAHSKEMTKIIKDTFSSTSDHITIGSEIDIFLARKTEIVASVMKKYDQVHGEHKNLWRSFVTVQVSSCA